MVDEPEIALFPHTDRALAWCRPDGWWFVARRRGCQFDTIVLAVFTSLQVPVHLTMARAINKLYEPGTLERLRLGVRPPDTGAAWTCYLATLERACSARP